MNQRKARKIANKVAAYLLDKEVFSPTDIIYDVAPPAYRGPEDIKKIRRELMKLMQEHSNRAEPSAYGG